MGKRIKIPVSKTHPHLMGEWDFEKNKIRPEDFSYGSGKRVWWCCSKCGYGWKIKISNRTRKKPSGCPACTNQVPTKYNNLASKYGYLLDEWDYTLNAVSPEEVLPHSNKKVWWKCSKDSCGYVWMATISGRTGKRKRGCPSCSGNTVTHLNVLSNKLKGILSIEWDNNKNKHIDVDNLVEGTQVKAWWVCSVCSHVWKTAIRNRTVFGCGCPVCANRVVTSKNNLCAQCPEISSEWDFEKNHPLKPSDVTFGCDKRVWWVCSVCNHSWATAVYNRAGRYKKGCPVCSTGSVSPVSQIWLDSLGVLEENREYYITQLCIRVDGYDPETNTVYEFLGDFWHGNPEVFDLNDVNPVNKKSFGDLHEETLHRLRLLEEAGYKVIYIWEKDFKNKESNNRS